MAPGPQPVQMAAQPELIADILGVVVFQPIYRVAAPAYDEIRRTPGLENAGVADDVEDCVGNAGWFAEVEFMAAFDFRLDEDNITQSREQVVLDAGDHIPADEGARRCVGDCQADAARSLQDMDLEILVASENRFRIVAYAAGIEHRQSAPTKQFMVGAAICFMQLAHFELRQHLEAAGRADFQINCV